MTKQPSSFLTVVALATLLACVGDDASMASADRQRDLSAPDAAGVWTGVATGTFMGQPYADNVAVTIAADGLTAEVASDSTIGPSTSSCAVTAFDARGVALAQCTFTSGPANGASYEVHFALTESRKRLTLWISNPALFTTAQLFNP